MSDQQLALTFALFIFMCRKEHILAKFHNHIARGGGMSFFPVKHEKFDAKNFSAVKSLNSGEAVASPAAAPENGPFIQIQPSQTKIA